MRYMLVRLAALAVLCGDGIWSRAVENQEQAANQTVYVFGLYRTGVDFLHFPAGKMAHAL